MLIAVQVSDMVRGPLVSWLRKYGNLSLQKSIDTVGPHFIYKVNT